MTLALIEVGEKIDKTPAAFHELAAAKYIGMNRSYFRELVFAGVIPYTTHTNKPSRVYLRKHLDAYLDSLPQSRMAQRESSPLEALKGAAK